MWDLALFFMPKLLRTTVYLYRFLNRLRHSKNPQANTVTLLPEKIQNAKCYWLKTMQSNMFPNEIALKHKRLVLKNSPLFVLNPYMNEDGLFLFLFEEDSVELASQERRRISSSYTRTRC